MVQGHTHYFAETLFDDGDGIERRCQCGARLWEPASKCREVIAENIRLREALESIADGRGATVATIARNAVRIARAALSTSDRVSGE